MFKALKSRLDRFESDLRKSFGDDISTPAGRRAAFWHSQLMDHAFLRAWWTNIGQVAPGVWRANQPSPKRLRRYHEDLGIKTVISLRGRKRMSHLLFEEETCQQLGIPLHVLGLGARALVRRDVLLHLLDLFETVERPFLMHCKSGADRAGLASALYLMHMENAPVDQAARQLTLRHLHLKNDRTGVLDFMLKAYAQDTADSPMPIREWIETRYDHKALNEAYRASRKGGNG